jgi:prepilin-type N-terminal cleavage/methylation domain-containing protein
MFHRSQKGFSLLELIITIIIMGIISVIIGKILIQSFNMFSISQNIGEADWQGLFSLEKLTNDIHNIRSAGDITSISSSSFSFVDMAGTTVTYQLSGSTLLRNGLTVASGLSGLTFSYLDDTGAVTASAVRYVSIAVTLSQNNLSFAFNTLVGTRGML